MRLHGFTVIVVVALGLRCGGCVTGTRPLQAPGASTNSIVQSDIPSRQRCQVLTFMYNEGFWLQVRRDGLDAIGFGALPQRVPVHPDAFAIDQVYDAVAPYARPHRERILSEKGKTARFDVQFHALDSTDTGHVYLLSEEVNAYMKALFRRAYHSTDSSRTFAQDYETIHRFWENAPFLDSE